MIDYAKYTKQFKEGYAKCLKDQNDYMTKFDLIGRTITSKQHPDYFQISIRWDILRKELDKPILEKAYYKVGDIVQFVKTFTYPDNKDRPHLLLDKKSKSYTFYDSRDEEVNIDCPIINNVYYENVLATGTIINIKTSDDGSGEILYNLDDLIPFSEETYPYVLEKNIITKRQK